LATEISCVLLAEPRHALAECARLLLSTLFDAVVIEIERLGAQPIRLTDIKREK
jgi:hypothetical protein